MSRRTSIFEGRPFRLRIFNRSSGYAVDTFFEKLNAALNYLPGEFHPVMAQYFEFVAQQAVGRHSRDCRDIDRIRLPIARHP